MLLSRRLSTYSLTRSTLMIFGLGLALALAVALNGPTFMRSSSLSTSPAEIADQRRVPTSLGPVATTENHSELSLTSPPASLCAELAGRFPALTASLAVSSGFAPAAWSDGGRQVDGLVADGQPLLPAGLKPAEAQAWLAMAKRQNAAAGPGGLAHFFSRTFADGCAVRAGGLTVWSVPIGGSQAVAQRDGGKMVYREAYHRTTAIYTAGPDRGEEFLYLEDASAPRRFDYLLSAPDGDLQVTAEAEGGLLVTAASGQTVRIEAPWVIDALGVKHQKGVRWDMSGVAEAGARRVSLVLDPAGMTYPVMIDPTWVPTGSMQTRRYWHTATLLNTGKVLVTGGNAAATLQPIASCELFDPITESWTSTAALSLVRANHTATLLQSGQVLVAGGWGIGGALKSCELYNPSTGQWTPTGSLATGRGWHTATLFSSGEVMVVGGLDATITDLASCEIYTTAGTWKPAASLLTRRRLHTATFLGYGRILVAGGVNDNGNLGEYATPACELYFSPVFPATIGTWKPAGSLAVARAAHAAVLLGSGQVLVAGCSGANSKLCELWTPSRGTSTAPGPAPGTWSSAGDLSLQRVWCTTTLLSSGKVLVEGGYDPDLPTTSPLACELYDPTAAVGQRWSLDAVLDHERGYSTATLLPNDRVLVLGGQEGAFPLVPLIRYPGNGPGDLNGDKVVNITDLTLVTSHFSQSSTHPSWNPLADSNGDGVVNITDLTAVTAHFSVTYP